MIFKRPRHIEVEDLEISFDLAERLVNSLVQKLKNLALNVRP